jgi:hypothetical protein
MTTMSLVVLASGAGGASAGLFTFSMHDASGSGSANVYDGGPVRFDSDSTEGPDDRRVKFLAYDTTQSGSLGASAAAEGRSELFPNVMELAVEVELDVEYIPSFFPGGDRPGGEAEAILSSIIEFIMPADEIEMLYFLDIHDTIGFTGSTLAVVENVTQSQTLLTLSEDGPLGLMMLPGSAGDVIRISTDMSGSGSAPAGEDSIRQYDTMLYMLFTIIPEPATLTLLMFGAVTVMGHRRR